MLARTPAGLLAVLMLLVAAVAPTRPAPAAEAPTDERAVERLLTKLEDADARAELKAEVRALLATQAGSESTSATPVVATAADGVLAAVRAEVARAGDSLAQAGASLAAVPKIAASLAEQASDPATLQRWGLGAARLLGVLAAGAVAAAGSRWAVRRPRRRLDQRQTGGAVALTLTSLGAAVLHLAPLAAFAGASYAVLPLLDAHATTELVALALVNAHLLSGAATTALRVLFAPEAPARRPVPLPDAAAGYLAARLRRLTRVGIYGFFGVRAAVLLGLDPASASVFAKLIGLVIAGLAAGFVLDNRTVVATWLRKPPSGRRGTAALHGVTARLAGAWHVAAVAAIAALYLVWALEVPGGFAYLARALALTGVIALVAWGLARALTAGLHRTRAFGPVLDRRLPGAGDRLHRYLPKAARVVTWLVGLAAVLAILQAWKVGALTALGSPAGAALASTLGVVALILVLTLLAWETASLAIERSLAKEDSAASTRKLTLLPLVRKVVRVALAVIAGMIVLSQLGVNIGPLLAGAGVLGLAVGFGAQTLVRDVITGAFILMENAIAVGDWIEAGGHSGEVEALSIRTVTLRDLTGTVHVVPFGDVTSVTNYNRGHGYALIDAGVAYHEKYDRVVDLLARVAEELKADPAWSPFITGDLEVFGLHALSDSAVEIRVRIRTTPLKQFAVRRAFLERMKRVFDEEGVEIPFPHRTIYFGNTKETPAPAP